MVEFREALIALRRDAKLTQAELASRIGVNEDTIGKWERGEQGEGGPKLGNLEALAHEFKVPLAELLAGKPHPADVQRMLRRIEELEASVSELRAALRRLPVDRPS